MKQQELVEFVRIVTNDLAKTKLKLDKKFKIKGGEIGGPTNKHLENYFGISRQAIFESKKILIKNGILKSRRNGKGDNLLELV